MEGGVVRRFFWGEVELGKEWFAVWCCWGTGHFCLCCWYVWSMLQELDSNCELVLVTDYFNLYGRDMNYIPSWSSQDIISTGEELSCGSQPNLGQCGGSPVVVAFLPEAPHSMLAEDRGCSNPRVRDSGCEEHCSSVQLCQL